MVKLNSLEDAIWDATARQGVPMPVPAQAYPRHSDSAVAVMPPGDPAQYQINVPPTFERDAGLEAKARQWFHRGNLPQGVVNGIIQAYCRQLCCDPTADVSAQSEAELRREWGGNYSRKIAAAQTLIAKCGGAEELAEILGSTGLGNDTWLIRTLAAIAEMAPEAGGGQ